MMQMNGERRTYPQAYIEYLVQFHAVRDYFECHEILEEYWKEHPESRYRETWVMLIQLAVSLYHERRGNRTGAVKLMTGAIGRFNASHMEQLGVDGHALLERMRNRLDELRSEAEAPFSDLNIPIIDEELVQRCEVRAKELGCTFGQPSDMQDSYLLNRHKLRDRDAARQARQAALEERKSH